MTSAPECAVEVAGGLVGEDERRVRDEGAGHGHALLLPARELGRLVVQAVAQAQAGQRIGGESAARRPAATPWYMSGRGHVLEGRRPRQQVVGLEDEADAPAAQRGQAVVVETAHIGAGQVVGAGRRPVEAAEDVHERRLARPGGTDDGHELALGAPGCPRPASACTWMRPVS